MTDNINSNFDNNYPAPLKVSVPVAVVVLNWNGATLLREYLPQVLKNTNPKLAELIVADNGSTDDSLEVLRKEFPTVRTLAFNHNYGFAEGYNRALELIEAKYVVLLNSDAAPAEGWIAPLLEFMETHPDYAGCQPKLLSYREPEMFEYAGAAGGFIDKNGYPYCRGRVFDTCEKDRGQYDDDTDIHWASGAALMVRRDIYLKAGGLDPKFFAHMEEIDLCWRLRRMGYRLRCVSSSVVFHLGGGSLPPTSPRKAYLNFRNNLLMLHKNLPVKTRGKILFRRRLLDTIAWANFLAHFKFKSANAIIRAHNDFRRMRRKYDEAELRKYDAEAPLSDFNIITNYYLKGRKTFDRLPRAILSITVLLLMLLPFAAGAKTLVPDKSRAVIDSIVSTLQNTDSYADTLNYRIWLPSAENPIDYHIRLRQMPAPKKDFGTDSDNAGVTPRLTRNTQNPADDYQYLIDWNLDRTGGNTQGFSAWFDGNHYRANDNRLQEYHFSADSVPFMPGGNRLHGVQYKALFVNMLPFMLAEEIKALAAPGSESTYNLSGPVKKNGVLCYHIDAVKKHRGYVAGEYDYYFNARTLMPVAIETLTSPGEISEQQAVATFGGWNRAPLISDLRPLSEEILRERCPEPFARRTDAYRLNALKGDRFPGFAAPTVTRERYSRHHYDSFAHPTVMAFLKPGISSNRETIALLRKAAASMPWQQDVIFLWNSNDSDAIEEENGQILPGEQMLMNVGSVAVDCGVTAYPTLIFCGSDGIVKEIIVGVNPQASALVINAMNESQY